MDALLRRRLMMQLGGGPAPGPQPVFYDRLVFDGTAYIDTDILFPENGSILIPCMSETLKGAQRIAFTGNSTVGSVGVVLGGGTNTTTRQILPYYDSTSYLIMNFNLSFSYDSYNLFLTPQRVGSGNISATFTKGSSHPSTPLVIGGNYTHTGQPYTGKMGTIKIFGSGAQNATTAAALDAYTPIYTLRPCTYEGEAGLWCVETSEFYGNTAGAGLLSVENA